MQKNPKLVFTKKLFILSRPFALPFKADDSRTRVTHVRGHELVQPQEVSYYFFLLLYSVSSLALDIMNEDAIRTKTAANTWNLRLVSFHSNFSSYNYVTLIAVK